MKSVKDKIIDKLEKDIKGGPYDRFGRNHIRAAINLLDSKILEAMMNGEAIGIQNVMSIYPDPGSIAVRKAKKKMGIAKAIRKKKGMQLIAED